jgi:uncharacterized protein
METPMPGQSRIIASNEYRRERWRNGAGWTREIVRVPDTEDWDWRLSIAEIERDGSFSEFPGIERELLLTRGNGVRLRFEDGEICELQPPHGRVRFAGERALHAELLDGPTHDFNLMWRRNAITAELLHRPLVGPMIFFAEPAVSWAIHLLAGQAEFDEESGLPALWAGDTVLLADNQTRRRFMLEGGGEILAIKLSQLEAAPAE